MADLTQEQLLESAKVGIKHLKSMSHSEKLAFLRQAGIFDENNEPTPRYGGPSSVEARSKPVKSLKR